MMRTSTRRLIVAPHMDDETFGCGGLLARFARDSAVVVAAAGTETRNREHKEAMDILGIMNYTCLGMEDGAVNERPAILTDLLDRHIADLQPKELYLPYPSPHQDHIAVYEAGIRAARLSMHADHWYPDEVYLYDINIYDLTLSPKSYNWNTFIELSAAEIEKKAMAVAAYASESPRIPHPVHSVRETAVSVGSVRKVAYAEQFALVRRVIH